MDKRAHWTIDIAGFVIAVTLDDPIVAQRLRTRYEAYLTTPQPADITLTCTVSADARYIEPVAGSVWVTDITLNGDRLHFRSYLEQGTLDLTTRQATLTLAPNGEIENFLRAACAWLCLQHDALLLHAAGVIRNGEGFIFFGPSGAGKSTTAGLSLATADVLSDDLVIVRPDGAGGYLLCGVPFLGELSDAPRRNGRAPLRAIYRLQQDMQHAIAPLPHVQAVAELAASAPFVVQHRTLSAQLLTVCQRLARRVPIETLHFKRDPGFWEVIDEHRTAVS